MMVTAGSIHVWLLSCFPNIPNKIKYLLNCICAKTSCNMRMEGGLMFSFQPRRNTLHGHHHRNLKILIFINILKIISCNYLYLLQRRWMPRYPAFYVDTPVLCESRAIHAFKQAIHHCHLNILNSSWCFCMSCYWQAGEQKLSVLMESTPIRQERVFVIKNSFTTTTLIILYGKGTVLTTFTHWVSTVNLGYLMFFGMFLKYHSLMCEHCGIACCLHFDWLPCCPQAWAVKMPSTSLITLQPHHFGPHRRLYDKSGRMAKKE